MFPGIFWPWPKLCPIGTSFLLPFCRDYNKNIPPVTPTPIPRRLLIDLISFLYNQLISKRLLQENKLGKKREKFKLELIFILNKWFSSGKKLKNKGKALTPHIHQCTNCGCLYQHDKEYCNRQFYDGKCNTCSLS